MVGVSGGEFGIRGFVVAFDAETGKQVWKTYTIPAPGRARQRHLARATPGTRGGASVWITGHLRSRSSADVLGHRQRRRRGWAISAPATTSTTASTSRSTPTTGRIKGHYQYHWNDSWDWDEMSAPMLIDLPKDGRTVQGPGARRPQRLSLVARAQRDGIIASSTRNRT